MHFFGSKSTPYINELLSENTLRGYVKAANRFAGKQESIRVFEAGEYKDIEALEAANWSPKYFGAAIEWLCENFFLQLGERFGVYDIESTADANSSGIDSGIDHTAKNSTIKKLGNRRQPSVGSLVYIQTKGSVNPRRVYMTNDGSRIMNFFGHAQSQAVNNGQAYQARYILFTTGHELHYRLKAATSDHIQVINYAEISKHIDGRGYFFDNIRERIGLDRMWPDQPQMDHDAQLYDLEVDN